MEAQGWSLGGTAEESPLQNCMMLYPGTRFWALQGRTPVLLSHLKQEEGNRRPERVSSWAQDTEQRRHSGIKTLIQAFTF